MNQKENLILRDMIEDKPILAIETSGVLCSASIFYSDEEYFSSTVNLKHSHSEKLFEIIQFLFSAAGTDSNEISSIAVSGGPGSFTGLRIGMAAAKGIATGADLPIVIVPTFEALAYQLSFELEEGSTFMIANKVNRDEVYFAKFQIKSNNPIFVDELTILTNKEFIEKAKETRVFGNAADAGSKDLLGSPSAEFIAKWALKFGKDKMIREFDYLEPFYVKNFNVKVRGK